MGSSNVAEGVGKIGVGGDKEGLDITSMDFILSGVAEPRGAKEKQKENTSRPDLKTWKRLARSIENIRATTHPNHKAKTGRSEPKESKGMGTKRSEK